MSKVSHGTVCLSILLRSLQIRAQTRDRDIRDPSVWTILRDRDFASRRVCGSRMIRTAILAVISCRDLRASVEKHYISKLVRRTRFSKGEGALNVV